MRSNLQFGFPHFCEILTKNPEFIPKNVSDPRYHYKSSMKAIYFC